MNDKNHIRIFITGGHLTPALAVIDEMKIQAKPWDVIFVGRKYALEGDTTPSEEYGIITKRHIPFLALAAGRVKREWSWRTFLSLCRIPIGFMQACLFCMRFNPDCIMSFGGYVAAPMVVAGWLFGVPIVTHEQTRTMGLANTFIGMFADRILVSYPETVWKHGQKKTIVTGLPIRHEFFSPPRHPSFPIPAKLPIIYVAGGVTGSTSVNEYIFSLIPDLIRDFTVIHQTGNGDTEKAIQLIRQLPDQLRERYIPFPYIAGDDAAWVMHHMALYVGRSGANTVAEVDILKKHAVFIPLPWSGQGEQKENASLYAKTGRAVVFDQTHDSSDLLVAIREGVKQAKDDMYAGKIKENRSAQAVIEVIQSVLERHG